MSVFNLFKGFTFNHSDVSGNRLDRPAAETKALLDSRGKELMEFINKILTILNSPEGADFINTKDLNGNQVSIANILDELMNGGLANNAEVKKLKEIFESLIINAGNSNAEIVVARKNYPTVGDRLDGFDLSLEENVQEVNKVKTDYAKKTEVSELTKDKATIKYVNDSVGRLSSATPLFANSVSEMTDTTKNYCNLSDGFIYTYNGETFVKTTNKYQEMGLSDKQVTPIKTSFIENFDNDIAKDVPVLKGYLDFTTGAFTPSDNFETTDFIELEEGIKYICEFSGSNGVDTLTTPRTIIIFDKDKAFSRRLNLPADMTSGSLSARNSNEKYVRVNMLKTNNVLKIYPSTGHKVENILNDIKVPFNNIIDIPPQEKTKNSFNFIGRPRKSIISFILDGEYDMNSTMESIFSNKGFKVGFAPQYVTNWSNNPVSKYLEWQSKGHEILSHGTYVLNDSASYTEEEAKTIIENSYYMLVKQGFNIKGFIGSSGKVADKYVKYVRDYYDYSATENNHSGAYSGIGAEPCLYFKTNAPYKLWRYSMEGSTIEQMKQAVDKAVSTNGLLIFYGHAKTTNTNNFTEENLTALCDYIISKRCTVLTPYEAIREYYSIRYEDVVVSQ